MSSRVQKAKKSKSRGKRNAKSKSKSRSNPKSRGKPPSKNKKVKRPPKPLTEEEKQRQEELAQLRAAEAAKEQELLRAVAFQNEEYHRRIVDDYIGRFVDQQTLSMIQNMDDVEALEMNEDKKPSHALSPFIEVLLTSETQKKNLHGSVRSLSPSAYDLMT